MYGKYNKTFLTIISAEGSYCLGAFFISDHIRNEGGKQWQNSMTYQGQYHKKAGESPARASG